MKYTICRFINGEYKADTTNDIVAWCEKEGITITGKHDAPHTRSYMQGEPIIEGFAGPMGAADDYSIRYEDWKSNELYSS